MKPKNHNLFTVGNTKTLKGEKQGYLTLILHLSPASLNSFGINLCPYATQSCISACLNDSGRYAIFPAIKKARIRKSDMFLSDRKGFVELLKEEIRFYQRKALREDKILCVRLNGTSDVHWQKIVDNEGKSIFENFPSVQFYDYTKNPHVATKSLNIKNYDITFSWSGENEETCRDMLRKGINVAVPFQGLKKTQAFNHAFLGFPVIDGDITDLRFLDEKQRIVGLRVKGNKQKKMESSFLVQIERKAS